MQVDYNNSPLVISSKTPRFSWEAPLKGRNRKQTAYQILVVSQEDLLLSEKVDFWDSGKVKSTQSVNIEYDGADLNSNTTYYWTVKIWDESNESYGYSPAQTFGTPLYEKDDWKAEWIGMGDPNEPISDPTCFQLNNVPKEIEEFKVNSRSPMMRKNFILSKEIKRARVYVCGLGLFELSLNGKNVGNDVLATPRTDFRERVLYSTYDITDQLNNGDNTIGLILGNGWFNGQKRYWGWQMQWYGSPRAIVQLEIEYEDGSTHKVLSDQSWRGDWSHINLNCIYDGERVDHQLEKKDWNQLSFDDSHWENVNIVKSPGGRLEPTTHEAQRKTKTIKPIAMCEPSTGVYVFDVGKNITGWVRLKIEGMKAGNTISLHFGEAQYEDGSLNASSNNAAHQRDEVICRGDDIEVFEPRFTFHGFQFVEIRGLSVKPTLDSVTAFFIRNDVAQTGTFECSDALINNIHRCTLQSQKCNIQMGVLTDDTQRPERLGWGADAWAVANEALYNLWMPSVFNKWIADFRDQQNNIGMVGMIAPQAGAEEDLVWSAAFVLIPWWTYLHCGDKRILEENYSSLKKYADFLEKVGINKIETIPTEKLIDSLLHRCNEEDRFPKEGDQGYLQLSQWGDHLSTAEGAASRSNVPLSMATAFYFLDITVMENIAKELGHENDALKFNQLAVKIKDSYNERFYDENLNYYDTGVQSAQAWAIAFGLTDDNNKKDVEDYFVRSVEHLQRRLTTGYTGTKYAIQALSMIGRDDLIWKLATSTEYPSWGYMLRNNRTSSCEQWNGDKGSLNHAPLGAAIDEWFYWGLTGLRPDTSAPGFEKIIIKPYIPQNLEWAKSSLITARGKVSIEWKQEIDIITLNISIPANCSASVFIPTEEKVNETGHSIEKAIGVKFIYAKEGTSNFEISSGNYSFSWNK